MNEELKNKLIQYLNSIEGMANDAILFGKAEIPLYLQELIRWEIVSGLMVGLAALFAAYLPGRAIIYFANKIKNCKDPYGADPGPYAGAFVLGLVVAFLASISIEGFHGSAKAYFAPRVLLVEKLSSMVRK
jgi:hypothetical protein